MARPALSALERHMTGRTDRLLGAVALALLLPLLSACGGGDDDNTDRGPTSITLSADPNGVYWDASENKLYLTDDNSNTILSWDGDRKTTFSTYASLPALAAPATATQTTLGEMARKADKTFYLTRFGFGNAGFVIEVNPSKVARNLTGLDVTRRRIAMTQTAAGELLTNWFTTPPQPSPTTTRGNVSLVTVAASGAATERELVTGLSKPVGTVAIGRTVYVSDQATGKLLAFPLDTALVTPQTAAQGKVVASFTTNLVSGDPGALTADNLDLMTAAPDGSLVVGGRAGKLYRVNSSTGAVSTVASLNTDADPGRLQVRGLAYDPAGRRLFVAVHSTDVSKAGNALRIYPID